MTSRFTWIIVVASLLVSAAPSSAQSVRSCDPAGTVVWDNGHDLPAIGGPGSRANGWSSDGLDTAGDSARPSSRARYYVNDDAPPGGDGRSWETAFRDLQDALAAARDGDEIWVAAGIYRPDRGTGNPTQSFEMVDTLSVYGGFAGSETELEQRDWLANQTILSGDLNGDDGPDFTNYGDNSHHVLTADGDDGLIVLDGLTITAGCDTSESGYGAGLYHDTVAVGPDVVMRNCTLRRNWATCGGGIFYMGWENSHLTVCDCLFLENRATYGGALYITRGARTTVERCILSGNYADDGGAAMYQRSSHSTVADCLFDSNTAKIKGGAIHVLDIYDFDVWDSRLTGNVAGETGGALMVEHATYSGPVLVNCSVTANAAGTDGGATWSSGYYQQVVCALVNCSVGHNSAGRYGGGAYHGNNAVLGVTNSIFWGNTDSGSDPEPAQITSVLDPANVEINYSCVEGWSGLFGGVGNIGADPLWLDPAGPDGVIGTPDDDLRLWYGSPAIDAGTNAADPPPGAADLSGYPRFADDPFTPDTGYGTPPIIDMGAYEFRPLGDLNCDGAFNNFDISPFVLALTNRDLYAQSYPGCDITNADLDGDGLVNNFDITPFVRLLTRP